MGMSEEIAALRAEVAELRARLDMRLGPKTETAEELSARSDKLVEAVKTALPVDRSARVLTDGSPVTDDHRELQLNGMQKGYVVLSAEERAKGFVRPVRRDYRHLTCCTVTTMALSLAETYARDPSFYSGTFCATCRAHFPLDQFVWDMTLEQVGS